MMAFFGSGRAGFRNVTEDRPRDADGKATDVSQRKAKTEVKLPAPTSQPHGVACTLCKAQINTGARYRCCSCADVDVCQTCRDGTDPFHSRKGGKHLMLHIPNTAAVAGTHALMPKSDWRHEGWQCSECKVSPIVGERLYCASCRQAFCSHCVTVSSEHPTTHPLMVFQVPVSRSV